MISPILNISSLLYYLMIMPLNTVDEAVLYATEARESGVEGCCTICIQVAWGGCGC